MGKERRSKEWGREGGYEKGKGEKRGTKEMKTKGPKWGRGEEERRRERGEATREGVWKKEGGRSEG